MGDSKHAHSVTFFLSTCRNIYIYIFYFNSCLVKNAALQKLISSFVAFMLFKYYNMYYH